MGIEIIKLGGSLFDLPGLVPRLKSFLNSRDSRALVIVPGGGKEVRQFEMANSIANTSVEHWGCIQIMTKNALWLQRALPKASLTDTAPPPPLGLHILDAFSFCKKDKDANNQFILPENRNARSDSIALRYAIASQAHKLWLIKSCSLEKATDWEKVAKGGGVDSHFPELYRQKPIQLSVEWVNFLTLQTS